MYQFFTTARRFLALKPRGDVPNAGTWSEGPLEATADDSSLRFNVHALAEGGFGKS
jgi:hypothetical protein